MSGDVADKSLQARRAFSAEGLEELNTLQEQVLNNLRLSLSVFLSHDITSAKRLRRAKLEQMLESFSRVVRGELRESHRVRQLDDDVDVLYTAIKLYLARMPREDLAEEDARRWAEIIEMALNLVFYNLARCLIMVPFAAPMARLCQRMISDDAEHQAHLKPRHLDKSALDTPALALVNAARETLRMGDVLGANLGSGLLAMINASGSNAAGKRVALGSLLFKLIGSIAVLPFVDFIAELLDRLPVNDEELVIFFHFTAARPITQASGVQVLFSTLTGDTLLDALIGAVFAIISYSSLAAVLITATLTAAGVISFKVALCLVPLVVVLGADVGTAIMARVLTFDLSWLSPLFIFFGVVFFLSRKQTRVGQMGRAAIGLGLILLALQLIRGTHIVRTGIMRVYGADLRRVLSRSVEKKPMAFLAGIGVTALVQSSNATTLLVTSFVAQNLVSLTPTDSATVNRSTPLQVIYI
ncbi:hypothetical protein CRX72_06685 [Pantoea sp. BRM17]|nr:hypothetical protein CRX72_06685 [Pantoea sp. BRM17]